ncbi:hypothetical protein [Sphingomonas sp.]|uniref:hypothetical protein n=1 Tax=Sphingomonas sp. TaxID=28214 RepID=UPI0035BC9036
MADMIASDTKAGKAGVSRLGALKGAIQADCLELPLTAPGGTGRRNALATAYMLVVDQAYDRFEAAMLQEARTGNFVATIASLGLATAGAVASGKTASILSAANTGVIGEREAFNKEFLFSMTVPALQNQMRASRADVRTRIYERMQQGLDIWPTCIALQDLGAYEQAGTIVGALVGINETTATNKVIAENKAQNAIQRYKFDTGPTTTALEAYFEAAATNDLYLARVASAKAVLASLFPNPPGGLNPDEFFARLADGGYPAQQRTLVLALIAAEDDPAARKILIEGLAKEEK